MSIGDLLMGHNDIMKSSLEDLTEKQVADLRQDFVSAMVKHQIADKDVDADVHELDHLWSHLVEKEDYATQRHFEAYAASRPKRLFVDFLRDLECAADQEAFAKALAEARWYLQHNVAQDPETWHEAMVPYVEQIKSSVDHVTLTKPYLLAPPLMPTGDESLGGSSAGPNEEGEGDGRGSAAQGGGEGGGLGGDGGGTAGGEGGGEGEATVGVSATAQPHSELLDDINRYTGYEVNRRWWAGLGEWEVVNDEETGFLKYFVRKGESEDLNEYR